MEQTVAHRERTLKIRILACPIMPWLWLLDQGKNYPFKTHHLHESLTVDKERKICFLIFGDREVKELSPPAAHLQILDWERK